LGGSDESRNVEASAAHWQARIEAAQQGDREALSEIFSRLRPYLRARAQEQLDPQLQVKVSPSDVVQETLLEAHRGFAEFHGLSRAELVVWVQGILNHRIQTAYRKYRGTGKRDLSREVRLHESEESEQQIQLAAAQSSPSAQALAGEEIARLEQALQGLPPRYEQVIRLRNELGLSFQEVGIALGCSADAARKLWSRAVDQLAAKLNRN
jgi:RNA polymerase sigma-70 factor (ECF subfamily)